MKTSSSWGSPPSRFYAFLRRARALETHSRGRYSLCVLGCADGKFVLPAARRGLSVLAIERDSVALFGGVKPGLTGPVEILGLHKRLTCEALSQQVNAVCADFLDIAPTPCKAVWTSGAIQYSCNTNHTPESILEQIQAFVGHHGLLYIDYMLPFEAKYQGRPNCPDGLWWRKWAEGQRGWQVHFNRVLPPILERAHIEFPVDHWHQWGHILLQRTK